MARHWHRYIGACYGIRREGRPSCSIWAAHLTSTHVHRSTARDLRQQVRALRLWGHFAVQAEDVIETGPDAAGLAALRAEVDLGGQEDRELVLEVGAQVPGPVLEHRVYLELHGQLDDHNARRNQQVAETRRHRVRCVGVVRVQHHGVQPVCQQIHDAPGVAL